MSQEDQSIEWNGCEYQSSNYYPSPNAILDKLLDKIAPSSFVVLHFIVRHTWGFKEERDNNQPKLISFDEFMNGRRRKDGSRFGCGTGLSKPTIINCIKQLEEMGIIKIIICGDRGREKHYYRLRMIDEECGRERIIIDDEEPVDSRESVQNRCQQVKKFDYQPSKKIIPGGLNGFTGVVKPFNTDQRKKPKKETKKDVATPPGPADPTELTTHLNGSNSKAKRRQDKPVHLFDEKALAHFLETLDLAKVKYNPKHKSKWLNELRLLREHDHAEMDDIKLVLKWYREYYPPRRGTDGTFTAHCIPTLRKKFFRFLAAAQDAKQNPKTIVNGIQLLTAKDAEKIHETESDIGHCHYLLIHPDWYVGDFYEDPSAHYQLMADIINESIRNDPDDVIGWRLHLRKFGVGYLVKKHEG